LKNNMGYCGGAATKATRRSATSAYSLLADVGPLWCCEPVIKSDAGSFRRGSALLP